MTVEQGRAVILPLPAIPDTLTLEFSWEQNGQSLTNDIYHYKMLNNSLVVLSVDLNSNNKSYRAKAVQYSSNFQSTSSEYVLQIRGKDLIFLFKLISALKFVYSVISQANVILILDRQGVVLHWLWFSALVCLSL